MVVSQNVMRHSETLPITIHTYKHRRRKTNTNTYKQTQIQTHTHTHTHTHTGILTGAVGVQQGGDRHPDVLGASAHHGVLAERFDTWSGHQRSQRSHRRSQRSHRRSEVTSEVTP